MEKEKTIRVIAVLKPKQPYYDFALQELKSLLELVGIDLKTAFAPELYRGDSKNQIPASYYDINPSIQKRKFFVQLDIPVSLVPRLQEVIDRSVMIRTFLLKYGQAKTMDDLMAAFDAKAFQPELDTTETFCFFVTATFKSLKKDEQVKDMERFSVYPWKGKCSVSAPDRIFWLIQNWDIIESDGSTILEQVFFGKEIVKTPRDDKTFNYKYTLKNRLYLGPTSTEHELAFLMVNQARVREGDLVLDPFVGTGSILIAAAHFKAFCFGTEIDYRVLRGKGVGRKNPQCDIAKNYIEVNVFSNFEQYGFFKPEILRMDCTNDMFKCQNYFDAIVCDPPYGIRAGAKECGLRDARVKRKEEREGQREEKLKNKTEEEMEIIKDQISFLPTKTSDMDTTVKGLYDLSRKVLKPGGRLVFLYHIYHEHKFEDVFPRTDDFELIEKSENVLGKEHSRLLITMQRRVQKS